MAIGAMQGQPQSQQGILVPAEPLQHKAARSQLLLSAESPLWSRAQSVPSPK